MPQATNNPSRGEIWFIDLEPVRGHEQGRRRPCLVVSANGFNHGGSGMVFVAPITKTKRDIPFRVAVSPNESGLENPSFIECDQIRSLSKDRLIRQIGRRMTPAIMKAVEEQIKILLDLR